MSDCPITIILRKRNTTEKEIFPYVFSHAKRKVREKTATFWGDIASFWKKTASFPTKHLYVFKDSSFLYTLHLMGKLPTSPLCPIRTVKNTVLYLQTTINRKNSPIRTSLPSHAATAAPDKIFPSKIFYNNPPDILSANYSSFLTECTLKTAVYTLQKPHHFPKHPHNKVTNSKTNN